MHKNHQAKIQGLIADLEKARASLLSTLEILRQIKKQGLPIGWYRAVEAGVIQNFEFNYELAIKLIHSTLVVKYGATKIEKSSFKEILIFAADYGIIEEPKKWSDWRDLRNRSSHLYNQEVGVKVIEPMENFIHDLSFCLERCRKLNEQ